MSLDVTVTVQGLESIIDVIKGLTSAILAQAGAPAQPVQADADNQPSLFDQSKPRETAPAEVDRATLRAKFVDVARKGKREDLKDLLAMFSADNVSGLPDETLGAVYAALCRYEEGLQ